MKIGLAKDHQRRRLRYGRKIEANISSRTLDGVVYANAEMKGRIAHVCHANRQFAANIESLISGP